MLGLAFVTRATMHRAGGRAFMRGLWEENAEVARKREKTTDPCFTSFAQVVNAQFLDLGGSNRAPAHEKAAFYALAAGEQPSGAVAARRGGGDGENELAARKEQLLKDAALLSYALQDRDLRLASVLLRRALSGNAAYADMRSLLAAGRARAALREQRQKPGSRC